jgi:hypothetical protein
MRVEIDYNGKTYKSKHIESSSAKDSAQEFYDKMVKLDSIRMDLKDGGYLVIGRDAVQLCVLRLYDD